MSLPSSPSPRSGDTKRSGGWSGARVQPWLGPFIEEDCYLLANLRCAKRAFFRDNKRVVRRRRDKHPISLYSSRVDHGRRVHSYVFPCVLGGREGKRREKGRKKGGRVQWSVVKLHKFVAGIHPTPMWISTLKGCQATPVSDCVKLQA